MKAHNRVQSRGVSRGSYRDEQLWKRIARLLKVSLHFYSYHTSTHLITGRTRKADIQMQNTEMLLDFMVLVI